MSVWLYASNTDAARKRVHDRAPSYRTFIGGHIHFWERIATRIGHNKTVEGLHFLTLPELEEALRAAGFARWEIKREAGRDLNVMLVALV